MVSAVRSVWRAAPWVVGATAALTAVLWPMPVAGAPRGLGADERLDTYRAMIDAQWETVAESYPDAVRPPIDFQGEVPPEVYEGSIKRCLSDNGLTVTDIDGGWSLSVDPPLDDTDLAVIQWQCQSTYAYEGWLSRLMSVDQRDALYDYTVGFLPTCYALLGIPAPATAPPGRADFIAQSTEYPSWSPAYFDDGQTLNDTQYTQRDSLCPPLPAWRTP